MNVKLSRALVLILVAAIFVMAMPAAAQSDVVGPDTYPDNVNPLTGQVVSDPATVNRRPVAVKVSNFPPDLVRPQFGLSLADIVYQHEAEGGTTRLTAIFLGTLPAKVGSMRSARLIDVELPAMYRAFFIYSGSSAGVDMRIKNSAFGQQGRALYADAWGEPFAFRDAERPVPHNFYADTQQVSYLGDEWEINDKPGLHGTAFSAAVPAGGTPARVVDVVYKTDYVRWFYEPGFQRYARYSDGEPHMDALTEKQITAENVVVLYVDHVEDRTIVEDEVGGGHYSIEIQLWGEGPCDLFRDGQRFDCRWSRADDFSMLSFTDAAGELLPLKPGKTWYQVVRPGFTGLTVSE
ncbi:MAG: DUF3048 domain-containing protein [Anaerolineae bacterium]|nr:DUF3048 domain-containing protein [Anaerolineae bacterium]